MVNIELNLKAGGVREEILSVAGALQTLDRRANGTSIDIDFDADKITGEIGDIVDQLNNIDFNLDELDQKLAAIDGLDDKEITHKIKREGGSVTFGHEAFPDNDRGGGPGGGGGGGGGGDDGRPDKPMSAKEFTSRIERYVGADEGSIELLGDSDDVSLKDEIKKIEKVIQDGGDGNLGDSALVGDYLYAGKPDDRDGVKNPPNQPLSNMGWNELRSRAADAGVDLSGNPKRDEIERRFRKKRNSQSRLAWRNSDGVLKGFQSEWRRRQGGIPTMKKEPVPENDFLKGKDSLGENARWKRRMRLASHSKNMDVDMVDRYKSYDKDRRGRFTRDLPDLEKRKSPFRKLGRGIDGFEDKLSSVKPTMGKYMQILAAMIPIAIGLGTQLLGVAAAMGSVAAAGAGIIGLGLLGHGESMAESFAQAKRQIKDLKKGTFQTFQPTMQQFAPIQARAFDAIPAALNPIAEAMEGLVAYEGTLFQLGDSLAGGMANAIDFIVANEKAISDLTLSFARLIGGGALDFFKFLIKSASQNKQLIYDVGKEMLNLAVIVFNVSMAVLRLVTVFSPLIDILFFVSELLNNPIARALISIIGWLYIVGKSAMFVYALAGAFANLKILLIDSQFWLFSYISTTWGAVAATLALASAMALITFGASAVIGGTVGAGSMGVGGGSGDFGGPAAGGSGRGGGGGFGGRTYNDNRTYEINAGGDMDYATQKSIDDSITGYHQTEDGMDRPDLRTSGRPTRN